mgnify:CR=1 FL=1
MKGLYEAFHIGILSFFNFYSFCHDLHRRHVLLSFSELDLVNPRCELKGTYRFRATLCRWTHIHKHECFRVASERVL